MLLAHQGGWDEFLILAGPVAVLMLLLWLASRWAQGRAADEPRDDPDERALDDPGGAVSP